MPIVNYIREHEWFIEYAADEGLTPNDIALYDAILTFVNRKAEGNDWPDEFIRIRNDRLLSYCRMGFDAMARSRNKLKQKGVIDYLSGDRNREAPAYKILYRFAENYPQKTDKSTDKHTNKNADKSGNKSADKISDNGADIYPDYNCYTTYRTKKKSDDEEDSYRVRESGEALMFDGDDPIPDRAGREKAAAEGYRRAFGRAAYAMEIDKLVQVTWMMGFTPDMLDRAMVTAAEYGARNPVEYTMRILNDWKNAGIETPDGADAYRAERDIRAGRI